MFKQLCVWPGTIVGKGNEKDFVDFMKKEFNARVKLAEEVTTNPDQCNDVDVPETGGRNDVFFFVHDEDVLGFAVPRLKAGIRWWEDVVFNESHLIYPKEVIERYPTTW